MNQNKTAQISAQLTPSELARLEEYRLSLVRAGYDAPSRSSVVRRIVLRAIAAAATPAEVTP